MVLETAKERRVRGHKANEIGIDIGAATTSAYRVHHRHLTINYSKGIRSALHLEFFS